MVQSALVLGPRHSTKCTVPFEDVALRVSMTGPSLAVTYLEWLCNKVLVGL